MIPLEPYWRARSIYVHIILCNPGHLAPAQIFCSQSLFSVNQKLLFVTTPQSAPTYTAESALKFCVDPCIELPPSPRGSPPAGVETHRLMHVQPRLAAQHRPPCMASKWNTFSRATISPASSAVPCVEASSRRPRSFSPSCPREAFLVTTLLVHPTSPH